MKLFQVYSLSLIFLSLTILSTGDIQYSKKRCKDMCGNVRIPYPFGIGAHCSASEWYVVDCNSSTPYLSALDNLQVLDVNLGNQTITINAPTISRCQNTVLSVDLSRSPFLFSKSHNIFVLEGCGNAVIMGHSGVLAGCSTTCNNDTVSESNTCLGISCCQTTIPHYLESYTVKSQLSLESQGGAGACGSAFLVDKNSFMEGRLKYVANDSSHVPISLLWTLAVPEITCNAMLESQWEE